MRKLSRTLALLMLLAVGVVGVAHAGIFDPKRHSMCYTEDGKYEPQSKDCDPNSCGCLLHEIGEYILTIFE